MPVTPSALKTRRKPCSFDYLGETVNLEYYPAAVGADMVSRANALLAQINAATADGDEAAADAALLDVGAWMCTILASWDYLEDPDPETPDVPGAMQPITPENLAAQMLLFTDFMRAVMTAIVADSNAGNANGAPSSPSSAGTSSPTAPSASTKAPRNRSASSSSHAGSAVEAQPSIG